MTDLKFPREVLIVDSANEWCHNFPVGTTVVVLREYTDEGVNAVGICDFMDGTGLREGDQVMRYEDFEEIVQTSEKAPEKSVAKRVKMIYTVQDSDGDIIFFTQDRDLAREVKAVEGGKANGIIIMQYGELKEIR